jgi:murein DD-endopeptidase
MFTKINHRPSDIRAMFYLTKKNKRHGDRSVIAGTAVHVVGILEDGIILNSHEPYAKVRRIADVSEWFPRNGHEAVVRRLDRKALANLAA